MRRLFFLSSGALALVVGCGLVGTYDYDDYAGIPKAESSSSSGTAGMGGMGGTGGTGGMTPECPPEGGTFSPDLCDNGADEDCSGGDCSVKAVWSGRYGDTYMQRVFGVAPTLEGGVAIAGEFAGKLAFDGGEATNFDSKNRLKAFVARLDTNGTIKFVRPLDDTTSFGTSNGVAVQGGDTFAIGTIDRFDTMTDAYIDTGIIVQKHDSSMAHMPWKIHSTATDKPNTDGISIGTTNSAGAPVYIVGNVVGAVSLFGSCPNAPTTIVGKKYFFLMELEPKNGACQFVRVFDRGSSNPPPKITDMVVTPDTVALTGYYTKNDLDLGTPAPMTTGTTSFVLAYHPSTHIEQLHAFANPTGTGVISFFAVTSDSKGRLYAAGTFKGSVDWGGQTYTSGNSGADFDTLVVAFAQGNSKDPLWVARFGGPDVQFSTDLVATNDAIYFTGTTPIGMAIQPGMDSGPLCEKSRCNFLLKLHPDTGTPLWGKAFEGGESQIGATALLAAAPNALWLGSWWSASTNFGNMPLPTNDTSIDILLARFSPLP